MQTGKGEAAVRRCRTLARLLDARFKVPGTEFTFGWDAIVGLLPVVGDSLTLVVGCWILFEARRLGLSWGILLRMALNLIIDWLIGLIPVVDIFLDVAFKANLRNLRLLEDGVRGLGE